MSYANNHFSKVPNINIPRSKYKMPFSHSTSFNHGALIPIGCIPVIPGDTFSLNLSSLIRMGTPIAPIMSGITAYVHSFFVPWRLIWDHTAEFFGENKVGYGPQTNVYHIPHGSMNSSGAGKIVAGSISHYLGKPICDVDTTASVLKERGYWLIYNEWYRAQQLQVPTIISKDDTKAIASYMGNPKTFSSSPAQVCKQFDYFTASTLSPQYGNSVSLPLGSFAPVGIVPIHGNLQSGTFSFGNAGFYNPDDVAKDTFGQLKSNIGGVDAVHLVTDLSQATAATINSIRYAFQVQKYLERSNFGSRYFEVLSAHYGVTSPDARLQRPEYLGGTKFDININQVTSTAGYSAGTSTTVGETGAVSVTVNKSSIFTKGFVEFGYVYVMVCTKQEQSYSQGLMREDFLYDRFEQYSPEFACLGDQATLAKEIMVTGTDDDNPWAYQEHWAELRYRKNLNTGLLDPAAPNALDYWTLGNKFQTRPSYGGAFIQESRDNITRCLKNGANGPDYIANFYFDITATRELPLYGIPGLVDHFGVM